MIDKFSFFIQKNKLINENSRLLLAISGGIDSMFLLEMFYKAKYNFSVATVNFGFRKEAIDEVELVRKTCESRQIEMFYIKFETKEYAKKNKISNQIAARELRYKWFDQIMKKNNFTHLVTAHHLNDSIETFFINLIRGTGINGLIGVPLTRYSQNKKFKIIRPLLFATKKEILKYVEENDIKYIEDKSNLETKYLRNKIRLILLPKVNELFTSFDNTMAENLSYIKEANQVLNKMLEEKYSNNLVIYENKVELNWTENLLNEIEFIYFIKSFLLSKSFKSDQVETIINNIKALKMDGALETKNGIIYIRKEKLIYFEKNFFVKGKITTFNQNENEIKFGDLGFKIKCFDKQKDFKYSTEIEIADFDYDLIKFPISIRYKKKGDRFQPLGMGHAKKISDFFTDVKVTPIERNHTPLFLDFYGNIFWIFGLRIGEKYKVTQQTKKILRIIQVKDNEI